MKEYRHQTVSIHDGTLGLKHAGDTEEQLRPGIIEWLCNRTCTTEVRHPWWFWSSGMESVDHSAPEVLKDLRMV